MSEIHIYSPTSGTSPIVYEYAGVVDEWSSLQWLEYYQDIGEVLLVCTITKNNMAALVEGNLLRYESVSSVLIKQVEIMDDGGKSYMEVRAETYETQLSDRVLMGTYNIRSVADIQTIVASNERNCGISPSVGIECAGNCDMQISWDSVTDAIKQICVATGTGFVSRMVASSETTIYNSLAIYKGVDRSTGGNYRGYFGDDIGSINTLQIVQGVKDYKNVAVVGGQGEGANRKIVIVSNGTFANASRLELWVNRSDLSSKYQVATNTGQFDEQGNPIYTYEEKTYTEAEYTAILQSAGLEKLDEHKRKYDVSIDVADSTMQFGVDYNIGDIVPIRLNSYGLNLKARVAGAKTVVETATGRKTKILLSDYEVI